MDTVVFLRDVAKKCPGFVMYEISDVPDCDDIQVIQLWKNTVCKIVRPGLLLKFSICDGVCFFMQTHMENYYNTQGFQSVTPRFVGVLSGPPDYTTSSILK